ncbi:uncharacterized protein K460DRAFT_291440 [Cucurbitaria berberidis CBS 394.84]|uniref:Zn(2)-C6 fungal-type domain-containing protein n=1 Tax=Cucurbitaria berberidis CBS 394.84 TaxID=1168544 RepID=A0A9P4L4S9_9PLEO|nr:uncharacterized protein K460DRAFT_291440 [Cucurbitaria berberidis CBS 394.84]KAF1841835.1 hypothetical protein K460DRAFT_291440 [Cucurbitaria berberidis CBS 394.84]
MLGYISSTRKKSCYGCVRAKRRCDLGYPFCKRCFVKGFDCKYPNAQKTTVHDAEVVIRQSTPDFMPPLASVGGSSTLPLDLQIDSSIEVNIDPLFLQVSGSSSDSSGSSPERLYRTLFPEVRQPAFLNEGQVFTVIQGLCAFVPDMAFSGSTLFIHQNLYQKDQPQAYQDCVALSALFLTKNARNVSVLANSIHSKIAALIASSSNWTLTEHLAAVQALLIYQIIRLFDPSLNLQAQAEKHIPLLETWSAHLWKRSFNEKQDFKDCHDRWVFNESLRRTVLLSVFSRCGWSVLTKGGVADQVPVLSRLPVTKDIEAWSCDRDAFNARVLPYVTEEEGLIAYGDMSAGWTHDRETASLDPFKKLLLVACRGGDDPRLLV